MERFGWYSDVLLKIFQNSDFILIRLCNFAAGWTSLIGRHLGRNVVIVKVNVRLDRSHIRGLMIHRLKINQPQYVYANRFSKKLFIFPLGSWCVCVCVLKKTVVVKKNRYLNFLLVQTHCLRHCSLPSFISYHFHLCRLAIITTTASSSLATISTPARYDKVELADFSQCCSLKYRGWLCKK